MTEQLTGLQLMGIGSVRELSATMAQPLAEPDPEPAAVKIPGERIMLDSVALAAIPHLVVENAQMIACYVTGEYAVPYKGYAESLFPNCIIVPIDVNVYLPQKARVLDVEAGAALPDECEEWISRWIKYNPAYPDGGRPVIYCDRDSIPAVREGTGRYLLGLDYFLWVATGDGTVYRGTELEGPHAASGVVACQNRWYAKYDSSVVFSAAWMPQPPGVA